jgi:hypothetical protein
MKPKNIAERRKAFWSFFFLFLLSTVIIAGLSFFSTRAPVRENVILQKQVNRMDRENEFSNSFTMQMRGIMNLMDSVNKGMDASQWDAQMTTAITTLTVKTNVDSVYNKEMYLTMTRILSELQHAKKQLKKEGDVGSDNSQWKKQYDDLDAKYELLKSQKDQLFLDYNKCLNGK